MISSQINLQNYRTKGHERFFSKQTSYCFKTVFFSQLKIIIKFHPTICIVISSLITSKLQKYRTKGHEQVLCQFLTKSVETFESESKISLRRGLQRYLTFYQRGPPNEEDNFNSFYVTSQFNDFFFFQLVLINLARTKYRHSSSYK